MPIGKNEIIAALPFLRRYARALTGSQGIGDQYVRIMLEMMERSDPALRAEILRQATARAAAMTEHMPNADFFRGRVEAALAEIVGPDA